MIRRRKFQAKPNFTASSVSSTITEFSGIRTSAAPAESSTSNSHPPPAAELPPPADEQGPQQQQLNVPGPEESPASSAAPSIANKQRKEQAADAVGTSNAVNNEEEATEAACISCPPSPRKRLLSPQSSHGQLERTRTTSTTSSTPQNERKTQKRPRKTEELDTKKFTMSDLIIWKPKTENTLRKKWDEKRQQMLENMSNSSAVSGASENMVKDVAGPRVKIDEKGEMVIDKESLVIVDNPEASVWDTVDDDLMPKKLNSMSFRKPKNASRLWSSYETDLFYEVLSATGTDFSLMHEFIPTRSRAELKKKYNKEEKLNEDRITEVLSKPTILDDTLYARVEMFKGKIEEGQTKKGDAKKNKKSRSATQ